MCVAESINPSVERVWYSSNFEDKKLLLGAIGTEQEPEQAGWKYP